MRTNMIINGEKLAKYLQSVNVSKEEFVDSLRKSEPFRISNKEDGCQLAYELDESFPLNLFARKVALNYEQAKKFINKVGAEIAQVIIDWEAMGMQNPFLMQLFESSLKGIVINVRRPNCYANQG